MADFTTLIIKANTGTNASPAYTTITGANHDLRFSDVDSVGGSVASANWPFVTRPAANAGVDYAYAYPADATGGLGLHGNTSAVPAAFSVNNYKQLAVDWDNLGTFASAPILTAYNDTNHNSPTVRGTPDGGPLSGQSTDTNDGGTARSYLKGNMYGAGATTQTPAGAPNAVAISDGTNGSVSPGSGAWIAEWQALCADLDYITYANTPTATTAQILFIMIRLFMGPNMTPGTLTPQLSFKYTYT